jgi:hypothetical protein
MTPSRRGFIGGTGLLGLAVVAPAKTQRAAVTDPALQPILDRYVAFGDKASGGPGHEACGHWLEQELTQAGYACRHQSFDVPYFDATQTSLTVGEARATVIPQAPVVATGPRGLTAPLRLANAHDDLSGAIALVVLPYKRWAALADPQATALLTDALRRGALGVILITTGPTGEAIALNVSSHKPALERPVAILAPKDAAPFLAAAASGATASLVVDGAGGGKATRPAFNLIARLDRGAAQTVVVSTPRSGWFGCAAERGSGLAVWLSLARWLARGNHRLNIELIATSGHEYDYLGGEHYLAEIAPPPALTKLWVHVGASAAARDWHELGAKLLPLPNADSQRVLTATADVLEATRGAFKGITGLEATYLADKSTAGGELVNVLAAGYRSMIGLYGGHRYFHTRRDDQRCVSADLVQPVAEAFRVTLERVLS